MLHGYVPAWAGGKGWEARVAGAEEVLSQMSAAGVPRDAVTSTSHLDPHQIDAPSPHRSPLTLTHTHTLTLTQVTFNALLDLHQFNAPKALQLLDEAEAARVAVCTRTYAKAARTLWWAKRPEEAWQLRTRMEQASQSDVT